VPSSADPAWRVGPAKVDLGKYATFEVPEGYRFTDAKGARTLLQRMRNPVSEGLVGLVAPDSGKWWVVLEYADVGCVRSIDQGVDAARALKGVEERMNQENQVRAAAGLTPISDIQWSIEPKFDANHDTLEWALQAQTQTDKVVNHTIRLLGRRGVLDATSVQTTKNGAESIPLSDLMANISFKPGEAYADYQAGDPVASLGLTELIIGPDTKTDNSVIIRAAIWSGVVFVACALTGIAVVLRRKYRQLKDAEKIPAVSAPASAAAPVNGSGKNGAPGRESSRRRKMFNYPRFYADMMSQVSGSPAYVEHMASASQVPAGANGSMIGRASAAYPGPNEAILRANLELIANQTNLIEEQRRLLQEQSKLIEEKTRLIREKNQILEKQAELFQYDTQ
jgi:uncharacterized membrane-anchored protein